LGLSPELPQVWTIRLASIRVTMARIVQGKDATMPFYLYLESIGCKENARSQSVFEDISFQSARGKADTSVRGQAPLRSLSAPVAFGAPNFFMRNGLWLIH